VFFWLFCANGVLRVLGLFKVSHCYWSLGLIELRLVFSVCFIN